MLAQASQSLENDGIVPSLDDSGYGYEPPIYKEATTYTPEQANSDSLQDDP